MSADGYGALYASNYLGHFLLTKELLPSLEAAAEAGEDVRITATSSIAHWNHDSDLEALLPLGGRLAKSFDENTLGPLEGFKQYGNTKLLQIHMCFELQRRLAGRHLSEKITVTPLAPGLVATAIGQSKREGAKDAPFLPGGVDAAMGAKTTMHALLAPDMRGQTNIFVQPYWSPLHQGSALPLGGFLGVILPFEMLNQKNTWGLHRWVRESCPLLSCRVVQRRVAQRWPIRSTLKFSLLALPLPPRLQVAHVDAYDEDFAKRLWDESEEVVRA